MFRTLNYNYYYRIQSLNISLRFTCVYYVEKINEYFTTFRKNESVPVPHIYTSKGIFQKSKSISANSSPIWNTARRYQQKGTNEFGVTLVMIISELAIHLIQTHLSSIRHTSRSTCSSI